jgi:sugar lactone lactonase YvrE
MARRGTTGSFDTSFQKPSQILSILNGIFRIKAPLYAASAAVILFLCGCVTNPVSYDTTGPAIREPLFEFPYFNDQPTGIAVSQEGRIFVNFPRWDRDPRYSVAEVLEDGTLRPYPGLDWNRWGSDEAVHPGRHFVCVQSVVIDGDDFLWILDPASPGFKGVVPGGAKLVKVNLADNRVERVYAFDNDAAPAASYLNDLRIDPAGDVAYITDSGTGAILVLDLATGMSRRLLSGDPSTKAESGYVPVIGGREWLDDSGRVPQIHADGIAVDADGEYLYYHALTGTTLYRIRTAYLKDKRLSERDICAHVERLAQTGAVDGMVMDSEGYLYFTSLEDNAVKRYAPGSGTIEVIAQDDRIRWPDSLDIDPDDNLYFTASQINLMPRFNRGKDERVLPYRMFRVWLTPSQ